MTIILLSIYDILEAIQYDQAILDFIILAQYMLNDKKTLRYIRHRLYKL